MSNKSEDLGNYPKVKETLEREKMKEILRKSLPKGVAVDPWINSALLAIRESKSVRRATVDSTLGALIMTANLGLRLDGPLGQAYLTTVAIKDRKTKQYTHYETQVQVGYRGLLQIAWRDPNVQDCEAVIVHENDDFVFQRGTKQFLRHRYDHRSDRGEMVAVYPGIRYKNGYYSFEVYDIDDIMSQRREILQQKGIRYIENEDGSVVYRKKKYMSDETYVMSEGECKMNPWIHPLNLPKMIMKTAIRMAAKYWRLNSDLDTAASLIEIDDGGFSQNMSSNAVGLLDGLDLLEPNESPMTRQSLKRNDSMKERLKREAEAARQRLEENSNTDNNGSDSSETEEDGK